MTVLGDIPADVVLVPCFPMKNTRIILYVVGPSCTSSHNPTAVATPGIKGTNLKSLSSHQTVLNVILQLNDFFNILYTANTKV